MSWNVLFDIDGTLLLTGGAGRLGLQRALFKLFGVVDPPEVAMRGRTDYAISREMLSLLNVPFERNYAALQRLYCRELEVVLTSRRGEVLPGVQPLLRDLQRDERFRVGLLTGNGARAARLKLRAYAIEHFFAFGGFGDWHEDRADVAHVAWMAAQQHAEGHPCPPPLVIGDTPADVSCARAIGAKVLAVATGGCDREELAACQPDLVVDSLSQVSVDDLARCFEEGMGAPR